MNTDRQLLLPAMEVLQNSCQLLQITTISRDHPVRHRNGPHDANDGRDTPSIRTRSCRAVRNSCRLINLIRPLCVPIQPLQQNLHTAHAFAASHASNCAAIAGSSKPRFAIQSSSKTEPRYFSPPSATGVTTVPYNLPVAMNSSAL